ncbi:metallophosphoesterase [Janthinobacterium sp. Mn2066]|uniref:metallophosphoesterase n=1 Tax=Janthinobacterium sp. Mn2066 TaxID=3395264 RepID=UPI003BE68CCE
MKKINWLHLSDFHCGQKSQWMWNNFKNVFLNDLRHISSELGQIDLVVFSGDMTQSGSQEEFKLLNLQLIEIWKVLNENGSVPLLFHVPGNHDLTRPNPKDAKVKMLSRWHSDVDVPNEFWSEGKKSQYTEVVEAAFANYVAWAADLGSLGIPLANVTRGIIPGDYSTSLDINGISVGLIGLNTSFLHLGDGAKGSLELSLHQLNALTEKDPAVWIDRHEVNFLVTHHPTDWLSEAARESYQTEIAPTGRFTAHMFGHMHEPEIVEIKKGGSKGRRFVQAASMFGLEHLSDGKTERIHGYSAGQITISPAQALLRIWPRISVVSKRSRDRKITPDHENFDLLTGKEYLEESLTDLGMGGGLFPTETKTDLLLNVEIDRAAWEKALSTTRHILPQSPSHIPVRLLQQRVCIDSLKKNRFTWIAADWGLGSDGFIWSVLQGMGTDSTQLFKVSLRNYIDRDSFVDQFGIDVGCSFAEYSNALVAFGKAVLILDEAPVSPTDYQGKRIEYDVIKLTEMILDFCPQLILVVVSRTKPQNLSTGSIALEPLDEPDTRSYLLSQPNLSASATTPSGVDLIFRRSGGLPGKIDSTLRTLRVLSLAELTNEAARDTSAVPIVGESVPFALVQAIDELSTSKDSVLARAFWLLKALTVLPHGETVERLKRIDPTLPIFSKHAEELLDRDLIQVRSSTISLTTDSSTEDRMRIIFTPQQVADYVLSRMSKREINSLVKKAVTLYFGEKWRESGEPLRKLTGVLVSDEGTLVANPHSLVLRLLADDATWSDEKSPVSAFNLCRTYTRALIDSEHYRSAVVACKEILAANGERYKGQEIADIEFTLARSLRMIGDVEPARELLEKLKNVKGSKSRKAHILLNLALTLQSLDDSTAIATAVSVIDLVPDTAHALHAQSMILELEEDKTNKKELIQLEQDARRRGFNIVANNLALGRVSSNTDRQSNINFSVLEDVYKSAISIGDKYTAARAMDKIGRLSLKASRSLSDNQVHSLMETYEYLYGERLGGMFNCSVLMYPDTNLGENARHGEVFDEQAKTYVFPRVQTAGGMPGTGSRI